MYNEDYNYRFEPQDYPDYFPRMDPFIYGNIVTVYKNPNDNLYKEWRKRMGCKWSRITKLNYKWCLIN